MTYFNFRKIIGRKREKKRKEEGIIVSQKR